MRTLSRRWQVMLVVAISSASCSPTLTKAATFELQHHALPDETYVYEHALIRNDTFLADTPQNNADLLVGTKADTGAGDQGELRSLLEFDLSPIAAAIGSATISEVTLELQHLPTTGGLPRIDGSPKVDAYAYDFDVVRDASTWNDPDGDGNPGTGDTTPGGTLGPFLNTFGEISSADGMLARTLVSTPAFVSAVESALAGGQVFRLILIEDMPDLADRDIAFFLGTDTRSPAVLPKLTIITSEQTGLAGDYNGDLMVDGADLTAWSGDFGSVGGNSQADGDNDSDVDGADFLIWQANFGATSSVAAIPEPSSIGLGAVATLAHLMAACSRARRRKT